MNPTDGSPSEERLARLLAAYEEGLRAGAPTGQAAPPGQDGLSPAERELLRANQEVVRLLRDVAESVQETRGLTDTCPRTGLHTPPPPRVGRQVDDPTAAPAQLAADLEVAQTLGNP